MKHVATVLALLTATLLCSAAQAQAPRSGIANIDTVVVIYAENRSFDNLYGTVPRRRWLAERHAGKFKATRPRRQ